MPTSRLQSTIAEYRAKLAHHEAHAEAILNAAHKRTVATLQPQLDHILKQIADKKAAGEEVDKLALQADPCYNRRVNNVLLPRCCQHPRAWIILFRRTIMDSLYPIDQNSNPLEKTCTGPCGRTLPATSEYFHRNKGNKDGWCGRCKKCKSKEDEAYREAHKEERKIYHANWRRGHVQEQKSYHGNYRRMHEDQHKAYLKANSNKIRQQQHEYYKTHRDHLIQYTSQYRQTERGRMAHRVNENKRRAQKIQTGNSYTKEELQLQLKRQKHKCYYCKNKLCKGKGAWHADHIFPLSKGGSNSIDNIVIACPKCNMSKHNKMLHEWQMGGRLL